MQTKTTMREKRRSWWSRKRQRRLPGHKCRPLSTQEQSSTYCRSTGSQASAWRSLRDHGWARNTCQPPDKRSLT
eukprot:8533841-Heterocapsa_arctica.AAC.1